MSKLETLVAAALLTLAFASPAAAQLHFPLPDLPPVYEIQWPPEPVEVWIWSPLYQHAYDEDEIYYYDSCGQDCDDYVVMTPVYSHWDDLGGFIQIEIDTHGYDGVWAVTSDDGHDYDPDPIWTHPDDPEIQGVTMSTNRFQFDYHDFVSPVAILILETPDGGDYHYIRINVSQHWAPWLF